MTIVFRHIVVAAKGEFDSKALDTGDGFSFTFTKALFLRPASAMQGRIIVTP
jgi:hypothetical protein